MFSASCVSVSTKLGSHFRDLYKGKEYKDLVFRIDKHESQGTYGINFTNLTRLMEDNSTRLGLISPQKI